MKVNDYKLNFIYLLYLKIFPDNVASNYTFY